MASSLVIHKWNKMKEEELLISFFSVFLFLFSLSGVGGNMWAGAVIFRNWVETIVLHDSVTRQSERRQICVITFFKLICLLNETCAYVPGFVILWFHFAVWSCSCICNGQLALTCQVCCKLPFFELQRHWEGPAVSFYFTFRCESKGKRWFVLSSENIYIYKKTDLGAELCSRDGRRVGGVCTDGNLWGGEMRWREWSRKRSVAWHRAQLKCSDKTNFDRILPSFFLTWGIIFSCYVSPKSCQVQHNLDFLSLTLWFMIQTHCKCSIFTIRAVFTQFMSVSQCSLCTLATSHSSFW